jgi:5-formyltetrahydrofolate cyclo-ligase
MKKDEFRKHCLSRLRKSAKIGKIKKNKTICSKILNIINIHKVKKILLYIPLESEVDVKPLIDSLRKRDFEIYVPFMKGKSFVPVKYRLPLKKKRFGIKEPNWSRFKNNNIDLDMVIVPIVGVDITYRRVGFGAGMYDRFFETLNPKPITVFTQLEFCFTTSLITDTYDIEPDYIIT